MPIGVMDKSLCIITAPRRIMPVVPFGVRYAYNFFGAVGCIVIAGLCSGFSLIVLASLRAIRYNPAAAKQWESESESEG